MLGYPLTPATTSWSCGRPVSSMPRAARTSPDMMDRVTECDAENGVRRMSTEDASARRKKSRKEESAKGVGGWVGVGGGSEVAAPIVPLRLLIWGPPPSSTLTFRALQSTPAHFSSTSPGKEASEIVSAPDPLGSGVFHLTFLSTWVRRRAPQQDPRTSLQLRLLRRLRNNRLASSSRLAPAKTATSASLSTAWLRS